MIMIIKNKKILLIGMLVVNEQLQYMYLFL